MSPLRVVVSVGTDHHRFDRLIDWVERWIAQCGMEVDLFVQHGSSRPPVTGTAVPLLPRDEMLARFAQAEVVITQVGPGTIFDLAALGRVPITVPRRPDLKEHVDGHQVVFGRFMAGRGEALLAEDEQTFRALVDRAVAQPLITRRLPRESPAPATAQALAAVIDEVMGRPAGFFNWSRLLRRSRPAAPSRAVIYPPSVRAAEAPSAAQQRLRQHG